MKLHQLLKQIEETIDMANDLSTNENDRYARCVEELFKAKACIPQDVDQSTECKSLAISLSLELERSIGATYPLKTLERRLSLLSNKEMKSILNLRNTAQAISKYSEELYDKIDEIISNRAEIVKDPWP